MPHLSFYYDVYQLWEEFRDKAMKETLKQMNVYIEKLSEKFKDVEPLVAVGEPYEAILDEAERLDVDLIIIGNQGLTGLAKMLHNNVGEKVITLSKRPVLSFAIGKKE
jgi:nucleotide-binding universal stress UspA family protein